MLGPNRKTIKYYPLKLIKHVGILRDTTSGFDGRICDLIINDGELWIVVFDHNHLRGQQLIFKKLID